MTFLSPLFLVGALATALPIVLHLLKREPESRVKFAVVKLLKRAPVEQTEKHRLRELLLLALRVATLVLFALAFARPFFGSGATMGSTSATVIALDTSYSMSSPGRFERARQLAREAIDRAPAGDLVGVVTFADEALIAVKPSSDRVLAASTIDHAKPGFGATRYRSALSASAQSLPGRLGTIVVVTDLQESGWDVGDRASIPDGVRVEIADVGPLPPNLAITAVRPQGDRIAATIRNTGPAARDSLARLLVDGQPASEMAVTLGPNQSADVTFAAPPRGRVAAVSINDPEGIEVDNIRYAAVAGNARPMILVITGSGDREREGFYVRHALTAGEPGGRGYGVDLWGCAQLSAAAPGRPGSPGSPRSPGVPGIEDSPDPLYPYAAVLMLSTRGLERRGREVVASYVRSGGGLLLAAGSDVDGDVVSDLLGPGATLRIVTSGTRPTPRVLAPADLRHPVFRPFTGATATLALVQFQNAAQVEGAGCQNLARFTTGEPALIECSAGDGRALVFASDLDNRWNDFPLHATFVPFLHEVVRYVSSARAYASEYAVGDAPAGVPRVPGVHLIGNDQHGGSQRRVVVNVDPREGDPARITAEEFQSAVTRLKDVGVTGARVEARQQEDSQHLWRYVLALMVIALTFEGFVASKTA